METINDCNIDFKWPILSVNLVPKYLHIYIYISPTNSYDVTVQTVVYEILNFSSILLENLEYL